MIIPHFELNWFLNVLMYANAKSFLYAVCKTAVIFFGTTNLTLKQHRHVHTELLHQHINFHPNHMKRARIWAQQALLHPLPRSKSLSTIQNVSGQSCLYAVQPAVWPITLTNMTDYKYPYVTYMDQNKLWHVLPLNFTFWAPIHPVVQCIRCQKDGKAAFLHMTNDVSKSGMLCTPARKCSV